VAIDSKNRYVLFELPDSQARQNHEWEVVGLRASFAATASPAGNIHHVRELSRLARHVPREGGEAVEFVDLAAKYARGAAALGVLKADADSLGATISRRLTKATDLQPLRELSEQLETFFAVDLDQQVQKDPKWATLYTVFSGGDDLLMVGPWDIVLDFAGYLHQRFVDAFRKDQLTISAGVAIVKPKFPIHLAVRQADRFLESAKSGTKDQCAALGDLWKWEHHETIIGAGRQLADWVESGVIQRGWLHTLLELAQLRRGQSPSGAEDSHPAMATARLAYHVARNWPKPPHPAREWIGHILREFDQYDSTSHVQTIHLPTIIRYAMLATRSQGDDS
jgi:CRISPR-associated protein Csm1